MEVRYKELRLNVKMIEFLLLRLHNCTYGLSYIASILFANASFYARTHVKITWQWILDISSIYKVQHDFTS